MSAIWVETTAAALQTIEHGKAPMWFHARRLPKASCFRSGSYVRLQALCLYSSTYEHRSALHGPGRCCSGSASANPHRTIARRQLCVQSCLKQGNVRQPNIICIEIGLNRLFGIVQTLQVRRQPAWADWRTVQMTCHPSCMASASAREQGRVILRFFGEPVSSPRFPPAAYSAQPVLLISGLLPASRSNRALAEGCGVFRISHLSMAAILKSWREAVQHIQG